MNTLYPIFLKIEGRPVLLVGGGKVAEQKLKPLIEANARVTLIAPHLSETVQALVEEHDLTLHRRSFQPGDVEGFSLVIGATDDREVQEEIFREASARHIPVNIVDVPDLCTFYLSSVFQKGDLKIAVSTNGRSPTLGKRIRDRIGTEFGQGYPEILEALGELRPDILASFPDFETRKAVLEQFVAAELSRLSVRRARPGASVREDSTGEGTVFLVGAGPGDPDLITVKGLRILASADVVVHDSLVSEDLLQHAPDSAEKIHVGKRAGTHCVPQEEINSLLIAKAKEGKNVVRLKGGDPFVFGRGGEEMEALRKAGIRVEIVPGITAGVGIPTALGIPLTHRRLASSVVFATGHEDPQKEEDRIDWAKLSSGDTLVIYMGVRRLGALVRQWLAHGISPSKPIAVIFAGTSPEEVVISGTLSTIVEQVREVPSERPGLIIVGEVIRFHTEDMAAQHQVAMAGAQLT